MLENVPVFKLGTYNNSTPNRSIVVSISVDSNNFSEGRCIKKNSSFKQVCEFPVTVYRRGSKDLLAWINGLTTAKRSPLEIVRELYNQVSLSLTNPTNVWVLYLLKRYRLYTMNTMNNSLFIFSDPAFVILNFNVFSDSSNFHRSMYMSCVAHQCIIGTRIFIFIFNLHRCRIRWT